MLDRPIAPDAGDDQLVEQILASGEYLQPAAQWPGGERVDGRRGRQPVPV